MVGLLRVDDEQHGIGDQPRKRDEVGARRLWLPAEQFIDLGITGNAVVVRQDGVAVRLCGRGDLRADLATSAGFRFNHDGLF
jgi:hypothetical protein